MAVARKGKNKIAVNERLYIYSVYDAIGDSDEGFWTLEVTADHDWQWQFTYPLTELELKSLARRQSRPLSRQPIDSPRSPLRVHVRQLPTELSRIFPAHLFHRTNGDTLAGPDQTWPIALVAT
jgi:hypothetical protein